MIAWLLTPTGSHGCDDLFLIQVVRQANKFFAKQLSEDDLEKALVRTEQFPLIDPENRVDIEIIAPSFVMFIEVKIDAREGENQLERYLSAVEGKALSLKKSDYGMIFLCTRKPSINCDRLAPMTWSTLRGIIAKEAASIGEDRTVLRHLLQNLVSHIDF